MDLINLNIGCEKADEDKLIELENAIKKTIEDYDCILLGGIGRYKNFDRLEREIY